MASNALFVPAACTQGDIRLVAGARDSEGRVEVCNQNQWGSVCDMGWNLNDGHVACRQAGFGSGMHIANSSLVPLMSSVDVPLQHRQSLVMPPMVKGLVQSG